MIRLHHSEGKYEVWQKMKCILALASCYFLVCTLYVTHVGILSHMALQFLLPVSWFWKVFPPFSCLTFFFPSRSCFKHQLLCEGFLDGSPSLQAELGPPFYCSVVVPSAHPIGGDKQLYGSCPLISRLHSRWLIRLVDWMTKVNDWNRVIIFGDLLIN